MEQTRKLPARGQQCKMRPLNEQPSGEQKAKARADSPSSMWVGFS